MFADETLKVLARQMELFERAAAFPGRPRERLVAVSEAEELFFRLHPWHYRSLQLVRVGSQLAPGAGDRRDRLRQCENRLLTCVMNILRDAIVTRDLVLNGDLNAEEVAFSLWALAFGTRALMDTSVAKRQLGIETGFETSRAVADVFLDALGWRPLTTEWNYERTRKQVRQVLFPRGAGVDFPARETG